MKIGIDDVRAGCDEGVVRTSEFIDGLVSCIGPNIDYIIPDGVRSIIQEGNNYFVTIEIPPQLHSVRVSTKKHRSTYCEARVPPGHYRIAMPWIVIIAGISVFPGSQFYNQNSFHECYFMTSRIEDPNRQPVFLPALLNCHRPSPTAVSICLGHIPGMTTLPGAIGAVLQAFHGHDFTYSVGEPSHDLYHNTPIGDMRKWEEMSLADPLFVFSFPWRKLGYTIGSRLRQHRQLSLDDLTRTVFNYVNLKR